MNDDVLSDDPPLALPFEDGNPPVEEISLLTPKPMRKEFRRTVQEYKVFYTDGSTKLEYIDEKCFCHIL